MLHALFVRNPAVFDNGSPAEPFPLPEPVANAAGERIGPAREIRPMPPTADRNDEFPDPFPLPELVARPDTTTTPEGAP